MVPLVLLAAAAHPAVQGIATLTLLYSIAGVLGGVAIIGAFFTKYMWPWMKRFGNMVNDWGGDEARPGVPARPGVMVRLENLEVGQVRMTSDITSIKHEVHLNSGQSIKDIAQRTEIKVDQLHSRVDAIDNQRESERVSRDD